MREAESNVVTRRASQWERGGGETETALRGILETEQNAGIEAVESEKERRGWLYQAGRQRRHTGCF